MQVFSSGHWWQPFCFVENKSTTLHAIVQFEESNQCPMLSVVRKAEPPAMRRTDQTASPSVGFGKMLDSLQGLQQRLEDFSIADVANAQANAQTLILRLKQVQEIVGAIALLKTAAVNISESLAALPQADNADIGFEGLENHPQLHAIINASKVIKLHRLMAALKANARHGASPEVQTDEGPSSEITTAETSLNLTNDSFDSTSRQTAECELEAFQEFGEKVAPMSPTFENSHQTEPTTVQPFVIKNATKTPMPATSNQVTGSSTIDDSSDFPTAEAEFETAIASEEKTRSLSAEGLKDFPAPTEPYTHSEIAMPMAELKTTPPKPVEPKQDSQVPRVKTSGARDKASRHVDQSKALMPTNESFDLRLLDDLVSNYGEFVSSPNLPATIKKNELQSFDPAANETLEIQPEPSSPVEAAAPLVEKHGDLDRQLKKIIKDYGEYDLYSDKQTTNFKKAGILAFVLLGLVFVAIYLFKAPPSTAKTSPAAASSSITKPDSEKSHVAEQGTQGASRANTLESDQNPSKIKGKE